MDIFDKMFDFDGDGHADFTERMIGLQMTATSREEAIELTGDDSFYCGDDEADGDDDYDDEDW